MLKREWGAESNGKLSHLSIPSKTATWITRFAVEDLPLSRTAALVPEFAVNDLPLGQNTHDDDIEPQQSHMRFFLIHGRHLSDRAQCSHRATSAT